MAPGAFPALAGAPSGKVAAPVPFLLSESPLFVPPPDQRAGGGEAAVQSRISVGVTNVHSRCDRADVEDLIEKRELWLARRMGRLGRKRRQILGGGYSRVKSGRMSFRLSLMRMERSFLKDRNMNEVHTPLRLKSALPKRCLQKATMLRT